MERNTLVTKVTTTSDEGTASLTDVITRVAITPRRTTITFGAGVDAGPGLRNRPARRWQVTVTLTEAERIALIETLGGQA